MSRSTASPCEPFADLDTFMPSWACQTSMERDLNRLQKPQDDIDAFYRAMSGRIEAVLEHLNGFDLSDLPDRERQLLNLAFAYAEVAHSVELRWLGMFDERRVIETIPLS